MGTKTRKMVDSLVPLQHMGKATRSPLGATIREGNPTNREHQGRLSLYGHTYSKSMDQPGKVANPARGQLNNENLYFPVRVPA